MIIFSFGYTVYGQISQEDSNKVVFDYDFMPAVNDDIQISTIALGVNYISELKKGKLINSFEVESTTINYERFFDFSMSSLDNIYKLNYQLGYQYSLSETIDIISEVEMSLVSNFENNSISVDDFLIGGSFMMTKEIMHSTAKSILKLGVTYNTFLGKPKLLPLFSYEMQVNNRLSFGIGFPESYLQYSLNKRSLIEYKFEYGGMYANITDAYNLDLNTAISHAEFSSKEMSLSYKYNMDEYWSISFDVGYTLDYNYSLYHDNDTKVFEFDTAPKPVIKTGIIYKLK